MAESPKHQEISRQIRADIAAGHYGATGRLPSEHQLVKRFSVSRPTVARALRDLEIEGLIQRRPGSGTYVRTGPHAPAAASAKLLGLLIPGLGTTEIFEVICGELASVARAYDYHLLWGGSNHPRQDTDGSLKHAEELCHHYIECKASGVFFAPYELLPEQTSVNHRLAEMLRDGGVPVVLLDRDLQPFPARSDFDLVGIDNIAGSHLLAQHLIKLGCRHLRFVARPLSAPTVEARMVGVRDAMLRRGLEPEPGWICIGDPADLKFVRSLVAGRQADAFICANDHTAAVLLRSLETAGVHVPRDVRVVGFDDVKYATLVSVPLTTVHQPCRDIAAIALRVMLERIADPMLPARKVELMPRLVVRESCGAYLPHATWPAKAGGATT